MNENLIATLVVLMAVALVAFGYDDGSYLRMIISAYLGFLFGKKYEETK